MKCLELNKAAALALSISQQCEAGEYSLCETVCNITKSTNKLYIYIIT